MTPDRDPPDAEPDGLDWSEAGAPRSRRFGDIYFSPEDGLAESRAVFLEGCGLPVAWRGRSRYVVGETGFGAGLNLLALLELWRRTREPNARLHVFSLEAWPLSAAEAARALAPFAEVADLAALLVARWPGRRPGFHRIEFPEHGVTLDLAVMEAAEALGAWDGRADAWFLDGFAPSTNPQMWRDEVLSLIADRSAPGARLATFTVAGAVRRGLEAKGFTVEKRPGFGRKKERLSASLPGAPEAPACAPRVAVLGAGIAGAALARAFGLHGVAVTVIEAGPGASCNPAALVAPRLDASTGHSAQLHAQAFAHAARVYRHESPAAIIAEGVLQLEGAERDAARFDTLAASPLFEAGALKRLSAEAVGARLGEPSARGGLWLRDGLSVEPAAVLATWLDRAERLTAQVARIERADERWRLLDAEGAIVLEADVVCLATGAGTAAVTDLPLRLVRGQASFAERPGSQTPLSWGGYLAPTRDGLLFGATHERGDVSTAVRQADHVRNLATLAEARPALAARLADTALAGRAGVRASVRDHQPVAGRLDAGLFVLTALGGRGFTLAPLMAEHVAALTLGAPSPLPLGLQGLIAPDRPLGNSGRTERPPAR